MVTYYTRKADRTACDWLVLSHHANGEIHDSSNPLYLYITHKFEFFFVYEKKTCIIEYKKLHFYVKNIRFTIFRLRDLRNTT